MLETGKLYASLNSTMSTVISQYSVGQDPRHRRQGLDERRRREDLIVPLVAQLYTVVVDEAQRSGTELGRLDRRQRRDRDQHGDRDRS